METAYSQPEQAQRKEASPQEELQEEGLNKAGLPKESFSKESLRREILTLAWPTITEQMLVMTVGIVSTILVARLGKESMAAVGMINTLVNFFQTIFAGLASGTTIITARVTGESGVQKAKSTLVQSIFLGIIIGTLFTIFSLLLSDLILKVFFGSAEASVMVLAQQYYKIAMIGIPFLVLDMVIAGGLRGAGDTKTPLYVTVIVNIINAVLSMVLIFGCSIGTIIAVPAMGVAGAAIAVTVARTCGGIMRVCMLFWKRSKIHFSLHDRPSLDRELMTRVIKVGIPSFVENVIMQGGFLVIQILVVSIGTMEAASYQIGGNIHSLAFMPIFSFSITTTSTVGQSLGRRDYEKAEAYAYANRRIALTVGICAGLAEFILAEPLARLYSTDTEVIKTAVLVVRGFALIEPFMGIEKVGAAVMRSAGDIRYVILTGIIALWSFRIITALLLIRFMDLGLYAIMIGIFLDFGIRAVMYIFRMKAGNWKYLMV